ncbi:MAG: hypothetical protein M5R36_16670 [Deltaproteobacteria bacterium]|nr:hypothetical protein [Deltaproteobacteria bacterium]
MGNAAGPGFPDGHYYKCDDDWWDDDWWDDDSVDDDSIDDDSADDDSADDDTGGDDDTESQCALGIEFAYDCGWALTGDEGDLSVAESTAECEAGNQLAVCLANCGYTASNCQQVDACVEANC